MSKDRAGTNLFPRSVMSLRTSALEIHEHGGRLQLRTSSTAIPEREESGATWRVLQRMTVGIVLFLLLTGTCSLAQEENPDPLPIPPDTPFQQLCDRTKVCTHVCNSLPGIFSGLPWGFEVCSCWTLSGVNLICQGPLGPELCLGVHPIIIHFIEACQKENSSPPPNLCPFGDGLYCGGDGVSGDPNSLYQCSGANLTLVQACANGCQRMPGGQNDQCVSPPAAGGNCTFGDGLYCGGNGVVGNTSTLYQCNGGISTAVMLCPNGCQAMPAGINDQCAPPSGRGGGDCQFGDGLYCGGNGVSGDPNTLFQCTGGTPSSSQTCADGCIRMPAGVNDQCAPPGAGKGGGRCVNGDGLYCGGNGVNGDSGTLYQCTAGSLSVAQACTNGCQRMPPGVNDQCAPAGGGKGPTNRCVYGDGLYCGGNGVNGDPGTLYRCTAGNVSVLQACGNGCQRMPPGVNDQCAAGSCPSGNGLYCGGNGVNGDPGTLYNCNNGNVTVVQACANGCQRMPAGVNDQCAPGKCVNGDGLYCGGNGVTGDPGTLYRCSAGNVTVLEVCGNGCQRMPAGVNDQCAPPSCPFGDGLYCGGDGVSGDPGTLYQCSGGNLTVAQACTIGCQREPAGVNDLCAGSNCGSGNGLYCGGNGVNGDPGTLYLCTNGNVTVSQVCANGCQRMPPGVNDACASTPPQPPCMEPPVISRKRRGPSNFIALTGVAGWSTIPEAISTGPGTFTITNNGVGSFASWAATSCVAKLPGDFNGDGSTDIALTGGIGWSTVPVATSTGRGSFSITNNGVGAFATWATTAGVKVLVGDFDGDGKDDIALTGASGWSTIPVATSMGNGNFTITNNAAGDFATWAASGAVALVGDFNGDGKTDIALTGVAGWTTIPVATSTGGGNFTITNNAVGGFATWAAVPGIKIVVGDFNGDGKDDIALLGGPGWNTIPVASSTGQGNFEITNGEVGDFATWAATPGVKILVGDFNGDGKDDIALIGVPGWTTIPIATSIGNGKFTITNNSVGDFATWAATPGVKILVGDFNGDGKDDIVLTGGSGWTTIPVATSTGSGSFAVTNNPVADFGGWSATPGAVKITGLQK